MYVVGVFFVLIHAHWLRHGPGYHDFIAAHAYTMVVKSW